MPKDRTAKKASNWDPEEKRGRPRTTWEDTVMRHVQHEQLDTTC